jgi:hypothetical protein
VPSTAERLIVRLRAELGAEAVPEGSALHRTHASGSTSATGAWSWFALDAQGAELWLGSQWPMRKLLQCQRWVIDRPTPDSHRDRLDRDINIDPCQTCRRSDGWACSPRRS